MVYRTYCIYKVCTKVSTCDGRFISEYRIILYTSARYEKYNVNCNMHMRCSDRYKGKEIWIITHTGYRMLGRNYFLDKKKSESWTKIHFLNEKNDSGNRDTW